MATIVSIVSMMSMIAVEKWEIPVNVGLDRDKEEWWKGRRTVSRCEQWRCGSFRCWHTPLINDGDDDDDVDGCKSFQTQEKNHPMFCSISIWDLSGDRQIISIALFKKTVDSHWPENGHWHFFKSRTRIVGRCRAKRFAVVPSVNNYGALGTTEDYARLTWDESLESSLRLTHLFVATLSSLLFGYFRSSSIKLWIRPGRWCLRRTCLGLN